MEVNRLRTSKPAEARCSFESRTPLLEIATDELRVFDLEAPRRWYAIDARFEDAVRQSALGLAQFQLPKCLLAQP